MTHPAILLVGDSERDENLYYATHFLAGDPFVYLRTPDRELLVVGAMEHGRAEKEGKVTEVRTFDEYDYQDIASRLKDRYRTLAAVTENVIQEANTDQIQVEPTFPALFADHLRQAGIRVEINPNLYVVERRNKKPEELTAIEQAQRATELAMQRAINLIAGSEVRDDGLYAENRPLTSERVRTEIEISLLQENMEAPAGIIVAGGRGASDPHWRGTGPLRASEAIVIDIFPRSKADRYFADMTRTISRGAPAKTVRAMYDATARALDAALSVIHPGVNGREVHEAVVRTYAESGFSGNGSGPRFIHGTGHGVGLAVHEGPRLGSADIELRPGDVVTVEPGLYDPELGGVRLEDLVVVTDTGYRNLTEFPRTLEV